MTAVRDTIFALASGAAKAGVSVFRISGPDTGTVVAMLAGGLPPPRRASLRVLKDPQDGEIVDRALVIWFPGPKSFTGEDSAECHCHGGDAVRAAVASAIQTTGLARPAEAGEFTRRAFANGRMDLTQAEALGDLIEARTERQRRQAAGALQGDLTEVLADWRARLVQAMALYEAEIDFPDEEVPDDVNAETDRHLEVLAEDMKKCLADWARAKRVREGLTVCLMGAPNAGKSSLMNALVREDVAIVTAIPGTTRDRLRVDLDMDGFFVTLFDTAGLRVSSDAVEVEGVRRAEWTAMEADLRIWVRDGVAPPSPDPAAELFQDGDLEVHTKADLMSGDVGAALGGDSIWVSSLSGVGLDALRRRLIERLNALASLEDRAALLRERHVSGVREAVTAVMSARRAATVGPELAGEQLRRAADALGRITGAIDVEDLLDRVFAEFCIGK